MNNDHIANTLGRIPFPKISRWKRCRHFIERHAGRLWRRLRGVIRLSFSASHCLDCRCIDVYYRMGCACWKLPDEEVDAEEGIRTRTLEWGWVLERPINGNKFISNHTLYVMVCQGTRRIEHPDGRPVTMLDFEGEDV